MRYDMIIGNDILVPLGIDCCASTKTIKWMDRQVPYKPEFGLSPQIPDQDSSMLMSQQVEAHHFHHDPGVHLNDYIEHRISHLHFDFRIEI